MQRTLLPLIAGLLFAADSFAAKQPNIVLNISDDQSWTDYSFMGHEAIETPNIDRLPRRAAYSQARLRASEPLLPIARHADHRALPAPKRHHRQR